jgi:hypothetical protein
MKGYILLLACVVFQLVSRGIAADGEETGMHVIKSKEIAISVSDRGEITAVSFGPKKTERTVSGLTSLEGCMVKNVKASPLPDGGMEFAKTLLHEKGKHALTLVEQFVPTADSIRWEIEIKDSGKAWTTSIETRLQYPATESTRFWTAWADPRHEIAGRMNREQLIAADIVPDVNESGDWPDPLVPVGLGNARFWYGAEPYRDDRITITPKLRPRMGRLPSADSIIDWAKAGVFALRWTWWPTRRTGVRHWAGWRGATASSSIRPIPRPTKSPGPVRIPVTTLTSTQRK